MVAIRNNLIFHHDNFSKFSWNNVFVYDIKTKYIGPSTHKVSERTKEVKLHNTSCCSYMLQSFCCITLCFLNAMQQFKRSLLQCHHETCNCIIVTAIAEPKLPLICYNNDRVIFFIVPYFIIFMISVRCLNGCGLNSW